MSHKPQEILFVTNDGLVMNNGYSNKLPKGVIALAEKGGENTKDGLPLVDTPSTEKNKKFEIRLGIADRAVSRSHSNKAWSSRSFELKDIVDIKVSAPSLLSSVDEVWLGYDGINEDSAIVLKQGETAIVEINLEGDGLGVLGYEDSKLTIKEYIVAPTEGEFTMQQLVEEVVARINKRKVNGGVPLTNFIEVTPINSNNTEVTGTEFNLYELNIPFLGTSNNIAQVKAQYPDFDVKFEGEINGVSKFYVAVEGETVPNAFNLVATTATMDCDETLNVDTTQTQFTWTLLETCVATQRAYTLQLPDDECGENKLEELQAYYPELTISIVESKNCQTVYSTTVLTNFVCEECSPMLRDIFTAEAPEPFEFTAWKADQSAYDATALMGIRVKGKEFIVAGGEEFRDSLPMFHNFVKVSVSGGYPFAQYKNFGEYNGEQGYMKITWISRGSRPEALGMDYFSREEKTRAYYTLTQRLCDNHFGNTMLGNESLLKPLAQYVMYTVQIRREYYAQSFSQTNVEHFRYNILVEVGKHNAVEAFVNRLATAAGLPTVQAYQTAQ